MLSIGFIPSLTNIGLAGFFQAWKKNAAMDGVDVHWCADKNGSFDAYGLGVAPTEGDIAHAEKEKMFLLNQGIAPTAIFNVLFYEGLPHGCGREEIARRLGACLAVFPYEPKLFLSFEKSKQLPPRFLTALKEAMAAIVKKINEAPAGRSATLAEVERLVLARLQNRRDGAHVLSETLAREVAQVILEQNLAGFSKDDLAKLHQKLLDHVQGYGPLEPYLRDEHVSEILINGSAEFFTEQNGCLRPGGKIFDDNTHLERVIDRMVGQAGRRVDTASPLCDVRLPDGSRVNVVLPPLSLQGPVVTIRKFRKEIRSFDDLEKQETLNKEQRELLTSAVIAKKNIVIAGNTGSGKTTLLNILSTRIAATERIITIEDAAELKLQQPHIVRLEARPANAEGFGEITIADLVVNALRMRPDRIIIGECRGIEAIPMLQAMNTGHDGSMTTLHANSAEDALRRLEAMVLLGAPQWPVEVIRQQIKAAIDLIVYIKRSGSLRRVTEVLSIED